jgi:hypothetical protein
MTDGISLVILGLDSGIHKNINKFPISVGNDKNEEEL